MGTMTRFNGVKEAEPQNDSDLSVKEAESQIDSGLPKTTRRLGFSTACDKPIVPLQKNLVILCALSLFHGPMHFMCGVRFCLPTSR